MGTVHYLSNTFESSTRTSRRKALLVGSGHDDKLTSNSSDPEIAAIKAAYTPQFLIYKEKYISYALARSAFHTATYVIEEMFSDLATTQCQDWNFEVRKLYSRESEVYMKLFHSECKAFYQGSRSEKLDAVEILALMLAEIPGLEVLRDRVSSYHSEIKAALHDQRLKEEKLSFSGHQLEAERIKLCDTLYGNLGLLMKKFCSEREKIENYFDFRLLKRKMSDQEGIYFGKVLAGETKNIMVKTFTERSELLLENNGRADLNFCLAPDENTSCHDAGIILSRNNRQIVYAKDLGSLDNHYLNVTNLYTEKEGKYTATILI